MSRESMRVTFGVLTISALVLTAPVSAQDPGRAAVPVPTDSTNLSLGEALARALDRSEEVRVAEQQVVAADAFIRTARSEMLPDINTQIGYTRTLRSVFQGSGFVVPDSLDFDPDSTASLEDRVSYLEQNTPNAAFGALGSLFGDLPFGQEHAWAAAAVINQPLFAGGRIRAGVSVAKYRAEAADASLDEARGDIALRVRETYYSAQLAQESEQIVEASVALAEEHLARVQLLLETGQASELDALRSEVELANLQPQLVQAQNARELASLNLKRLVNLPMDLPIRLTTELSPSDPALPDPDDVSLPPLSEAERQLDQRASVRAAEAQVDVRRQEVKIARSMYLPTVSLTGNLARQAFPVGFTPGDWRDDWTVGFVMQWPLFQGLRRGADMDIAQAQVREAELQTEQLREGVRLEYEQALNELEQARAQIVAATRTVSQAERVYELTELRFTEGLATQLDVSDARLSLQQSRTNQATAYFDFYSALARAQRALGLPLTEVR